MSSNMYISLGDTVKGESTADDFEEQIEVHSFSYDCSQSLSPVRSSGIHVSGRASHGLFHFTKLCDLSTPSLLQTLWTGKTLEQAVFSVVSKDGETGTNIVYLKITMSDVVVASFSINGGGDIPYESVALNFASIQIDYQAQAQGGNPGGTNSAVHNLSTEKSE